MTSEQSLSEPWLSRDSPTRVQASERLKATWQMKAQMTAQCLSSASSCKPLQQVHFQSVDPSVPLETSAV